MARTILADELNIKDLNNALVNAIEQSLQTQTYIGALVKCEHKVVDWS